MVATSLYKLAALHTIQKKYEEAEPLYMRALTIRDKGWIQGLNSLALLYVAQGKYKQAEPLYRQALASISKTFDPDQENLILTLENYASLVRKLNRRDEAAELEARAKRVRANR